MEEIKEIILSYCKGIAYPEFELEDLNVMVKEINDHYTNVQSQELTKAKEELRMLPRAVIEECMRHLLELSRGSASSSSFHFVISQLNIFKNQIHNSTPPETLSQISAIIKTNKSQAKEIERLKGWVLNADHRTGCNHKNLFRQFTNGIPGNFENGVCNCGLDELLKEVK
jgi:hypothetical protein